MNQYKDHVVLDVEIQKSIGGPERLTWSDTDKVGVSVAVLYEFNSDRFRIYGPDDVNALQARLMLADRISGFNIWKFDFPVVFGLPGNQRVTSLLPITNDILRRIWEAQGLNPDTFNPITHGGWSLDNVVKGTLHKDHGKIANGAQAPIWFQAGQIWKVINYCIDDVALERDLAIFVDRHGYVINGKTQEVLYL
jgi:DEAD/DEAH box helicase domain-containing protein